MERKALSLETQRGRCQATDCDDDPGLALYESKGEGDGARHMELPVEGIPKQVTDGLRGIAAMFATTTLPRKRRHSVTFCNLAHDARGPRL
jgi:hypothetical protein